MLESCLRDYQISNFFEGRCLHIPLLPPKEGMLLCNMLCLKCRHNLIQQLISSDHTSTTFSNDNPASGTLNQLINVTRGIALSYFSIFF